MDNLNKLKIKQGSMETKGTFWNLVECMKDFDREHTGKVEEDVYYCIFAQKYGLKLKKQIEALEENTPKVVQKDLEEEIKDIAEEWATKEIEKFRKSPEGKQLESIEHLIIGTSLEDFAENNPDYWKNKENEK
jgi:hypothetical protein